MRRNSHTSDTGGKNFKKVWCHRSLSILRQNDHRCQRLLRSREVRDWKVIHRFGNVIFEKPIHSKVLESVDSSAYLYFRTENGVVE